MSNQYHRYLCLGCGFLYDELMGLPEHGIAPGTPWEQIPEGWACPDCVTPRACFETLSIPCPPGESELSSYNTL
ncbi:MAG TPA: rubredoxin [Edaphobacter sp.]|nr:rubredoxin [Edaphobacter sp.]